MNGFVVLNKEEGMSSFFAAGCLRKIFNEKKTGHAGTLDPMAVGVLPVAMGQATRFIDFLPDSVKSYVARFRFGTTTDTLDRTGTVLTQTSVSVSPEEVLAILPSFTSLAYFLKRFLICLLLSPLSLRITLPWSVKYV